MSFYKKHKDQRLKKQSTIERKVSNLNAFVVVLKTADNKALFVAKRRVF